MRPAIHAFSVASAAIVAVAAATPAAAQSAPTFSASSQPTQYDAMRLLARDTDHDGLPDLVIATVGPQTAWPATGGLELAFGAPNGGILPPIALGIPILAWAPIYGSSINLSFDVVDENGDGILDVVALTGPTIDRWIGAGNGTFVTPTSSASPNGLATDLLVGDWNGDGKPDALAAQYTNSKLRTLLAMLGNGAGTFQYLNTPQTTASIPFGLLAMDANLDGALDVVFSPMPNCGYCGPGPNPPTLLAVKGDGTGGVYGILANTTLTGNALHCAAGDVNLDGKADLLFVEANDTKIRIGATGGAGLFKFNYQAAIGAAVGDFALGDLDGDGLQDLVATFANAPGFAIAMGMGQMTFGAATTVTGAATTPSPDVVLADFDLDGRLDVATADGTARSVTLYLQGSAAPAGIVAFGTGTPGCAGQVTLGALASLSASQSGITVTATNAPPAIVGILFFGDVADVAGSDLLGIGALFHVDLFQSAFVASVPIPTKSGGTASVTLAGAPSPQFVGATFTAQAAFLEGPSLLGSMCSGATLGIVTSRGLTLTVQP